jgi:hypothetical protein
MIKRNYNPLGQFQQHLFHLLVSIFEETEGEQPNLLINDKDLLLKMNICEHLSSITTINDLNTLKKFFVLSKLSMQSIKLINNNDYRLQWIDVYYPK